MTSIKWNKQGKSKEVSESNETEMRVDEKHYV